MNLEYNFYAEMKKLNRLQPDDPRFHMLRAIYEHELDARFMAWKAACKELGVKRLDIDKAGCHVNFTPYQQTTALRSLMQQYWNKNTNNFPVRLPPKFWGLHVL